MDAAAVVFDFDGVLVESVDIKTQAFARLYEPYGPDIVRRVVAHNIEHGSVSRFEKFRHYQEAFLGQPANPDVVQALAQRFGTLVEEAVAAAAWVSGARALLDHLAGRVPLFVVSGTPEDELRRIVEARGMAHYFREVRGSPARKPDILRDLIARFSLVPARTVMVGDSLGDYEAAAATGLGFVGRVPPGHDNPFPAGLPVVGDLRPLLPGDGAVLSTPARGS